MKVQSILQSKGTDVFCVAKSDKISDAVTLLTLKRIGAVAVTDQAGALCGILSERDIVRRMGQGEKSVQSLSVESCMTPDPYTCAPEASVDSVLERMTKHRIRHMPVVQGNELIGLVTIGDIVKSKIDETVQEAEALRDYIAT